MNNKVDFYLTCANELVAEADLSLLRECSIVKKLKDPKTRNTWFIVEVSPPVIGQPYGLGEKDIHYLALASRLEGQSLNDIPDSPLQVYVLRLGDNNKDIDNTVCADWVLEAWGMIVKKPSQAPKPMNR